MNPLAAAQAKLDRHIEREGLKQTRQRVIIHAVCTSLDLGAQLRNAVGLGARGPVKLRACLAERARPIRQRGLVRCQLANRRPAGSACISYGLRSSRSQRRAVNARVGTCGV